MKAATTVIIGTGNLGSHLAWYFSRHIPGSLHLHSRQLSSVQALAESINASYSTDFKDIPTKAKLYIISINDHALSDLCQNTLLKKQIDNGLTVHTAGAVPMDILQGLSENIGVFYPLQSFSKNIPVDFQNIPLCIEANNPKNTKILEEYGKQVSSSVQIMDSRQRLRLHLAAVFANNFSNHMLSLAENILEENKLDFKILHPIIRNTFEKVMCASPAQVQTGPAVRQDKVTLKKHEKLLQNNPNLQKMYSFVSQSIMNLQTKNG